MMEEKNVCPLCRGEGFTNLNMKFFTSTVTVYETFNGKRSYKRVRMEVPAALHEIFLMNFSKGEDVAMLMVNLDEYEKGTGLDELNEALEEARSEMNG